MASLKIAVVTLFPEMFTALTDYGVTGRAVAEGIVEIQYFNPRDYAEDRHCTVDDRPYGGGPGMVLMVEPLYKAVTKARQWVDAELVNKLPTRVIYLSPQGRLLKSAAVKMLSQSGNLVLIAGRYEGVDERFIQLYVDEEWSIGDYVLSGGELPAMVLMDAVIRQLPGVLGHRDSADQDSFAEGLLDCPHYTRPEHYQNLLVPEVLLSGNHAKIRRWRLQQSLLRTWQRRPELLEELTLSPEQQALLHEVISKLSDDKG